MIASYCILLTQMYFFFRHFKVIFVMATTPLAPTPIAFIRLDKTVYVFILTMFPSPVEG